MAGKQKSNGATLDFQSQLWAAADKLRGHMDASEYKHVVLGLVFLKYISDSFEELHTRLLYNVFIGSLVGVSPSMVGEYATHLRQHKSKASS
jgi:type I restriction-modification system DNA methylase subunit